MNPPNPKNYNETLLDYIKYSKLIIYHTQHLKSGSSELQVLCPRLPIYKTFTS